MLTLGKFSRLGWVLAVAVVCSCSGDDDSGPSACAGAGGDPDADDVCQAADNCPDDQNPTQRDTDEDGHITQIGLALELSPAPPSVPLFLRLGEFLGGAAGRAATRLRQRRDGAAQPKEPPEAAP